MKQPIDPVKSVELFQIANQMKSAGLPDDFISQAVFTASEFEGVYDLMALWKEESNDEERNEIVADIQDMIDDCKQQEHRKTAYIRFNDLEKIAEDIRAFKDSLLKEVMRRGNITDLSRRTGIPQPSLSRFFNSSSMPRRSTLLRIAEALGLDRIKIACEWTKD